MSVQKISNVTAVSGATLITVASGWANLLDVMPYALSGQGGASTSGQVIGVYDAVSGIANPDISGAKILYQFNFGNQSGNSPPVASIPPQLHASDQITALSGLVVQGIAGWSVTVVYAK